MSNARLVALIGITMAAPLAAAASDVVSDRPFDSGRPFDAAPLRLDDPADGRRTLGAFGTNLGRSFVSVFQRDNLAPFLVGAAVAGGGSFLDRPMYGKGVLATAGSRAGHPTVILPLVSGLFLAGRMSTSGSFRAATYDMAQAMVVTGAYTEILKRTVGRNRPDLSDRRSFPSGHTSNMFALATVANAHFGAKVGIPAYVAAAAVGSARIDKNVHNLSDVLAGATLGYVIGRTVVRQGGETERGRARWRLTPATAPSGGGVGAGLAVDW
jgi:membrane-associated phospholipid phosphatase